jgi:hypothetical protein
VSQIQCLSSYFASKSHLLNLLFSVHWSHFLQFALEGLASDAIVRLLNRVRDLPVSLEAPWERPHWASVFEPIIYPNLLLLMEKLVDVPEVLETYLIAEEGRRETKFNASRALKSGLLLAFRILTDFVSNC